MNILLTGSGGFIGRNMNEYFATRGYNILAPKRQELDLTDEAAVERYFHKNGIDVIIHSAMVADRESSKAPAGSTDVVEKNLRMFFNLERCMTPAMRMIHLGSGAEYSRSHWHRKMPEEFFGRHIPEDSYGYSKYLISRYLPLCEGVVCLRIFGIFGRFEDYAYRFISNAIVKNLLKLPIVINRNVIYDYLYVDDLTRIIDYFVHNPAKRRYYNVTPTESVDLVTAAKLVNEVGGYQSEIVVLNEGIGTECSGDNSRLRDEIGDLRFTSYRDAIAELYRYYSGVLDTLDAAAVRRDRYLEYVSKNHKAPGA